MEFNTMKKAAVLILGVIMISILSSFISSLFGSSISPKRKIAYQITNELGKKLKTKYGLNFMGISEEAPDGKYKCIGIELSFPKILTKDEGRALLLNCVQDVLKSFNSHPEFEQHMVNVPFTGKNIIVNFYIRPPKNPDVYHPDYIGFSFFNNNLWYYTAIPENPYQYHTKEKETYEEAMKIVEAQQKGEFPFSKS